MSRRTKQTARSQSYRPEVSTINLVSSDEEGDDEQHAHRERYLTRDREPAEAAKGANDEDEDEGECCPVSEEPYEEKGANQPLVMPHCGHTFSRATIEGLLGSTGPRPLACPLCTAKQPSVKRVSACPPNWDTIRRIELLSGKKKSKTQHREAEGTSKTKRKSQELEEAGTSNAHPKRSRAAEASNVARLPDTADTPAHVNGGSTSALPGGPAQPQSIPEASPRIHQPHTYPILVVESGRGEAAKRSERVPEHQLPVRVKCKDCGHKHRKGTKVACTRSWDQEKTFLGKTLVTLTLSCIGCARVLVLFTNPFERDFQCGMGVATPKASTSQAHTGAIEGPAARPAGGAGTSRAALVPGVEGLSRHRLSNDSRPSATTNPSGTSGLFNYRGRLQLMGMPRPARAVRFTVPRSGAREPVPRAQGRHAPATSAFEEPIPRRSPTGAACAAATQNGGRAQHPEPHAQRSSRTGQEASLRRARALAPDEAFRAKYDALMARHDGQGHHQAGGSVHVARTGPKASSARQKHAGDESGAVIATTSGSTAASAGAGPSGAARAGPSGVTRPGASGAAQAGPSGAARAAISAIAGARPPDVSQINKEKRKRKSSGDAESRSDVDLQAILDAGRYDGLDPQTMEVIRRVNKRQKKSQAQNAGSSSVCT